MKPRKNGRRTPLPAGARKRANQPPAEGAATRRASGPPGSAPAETVGVPADSAQAQAAGAQGAPAQGAPAQGAPAQATTVQGMAADPAAVPGLYVVGSPIGHLADITIRALATLRSATLIACEDTRHSLRLLRAYGIVKPLVSCNSHNEAERVTKIVSTIQSGGLVAYLSDAGTPGVSDPGAVIVAAVRAAGLAVIPVPGPSALTTLVSAAGFGGRELLFEGFLSPKAGRRRTRLSELLALECRFVVFESVHRIERLLGDIGDLAPERLLCLGREMTKIHEEYLHGTATQVLHALQDRSSMKGEFTVMVGAPKNG